MGSTLGAFCALELLDPNSVKDEYLVEKVFNTNRYASVSYLVKLKETTLSAYSTYLAHGYWEVGRSSIRY